MFVFPTIIDAPGEFPVPGFPGKEYLFTASGDFSSGTLKLQYADHQGIWFDVEDASWTANAEARYVYPPHGLRLSLDSGDEASIRLSFIPIVS